MGKKHFKKTENIVEDFKTNSSFTLVKIITVVLAAMTTAFFSAKLSSSFESSVIVAGIVALVSFSLNEVYSYIFHKTHITVKTKIPSLFHNENLLETQKEDTSTQSSLESSYNDSYTPTTTSLWIRLWKNSSFRYSFLFFTVTVISLTINLLMPTTVENVELHPVTTIEQKVSDTEKQNIIEETQKKVEKQLPLSIKEISKNIDDYNNSTLEKQQEETNQDINSLEKNITTVQKDLESVKQENESLRDTITSLKNEIEFLKGEIQQKDQQLENNQNETPSSSPSYATP